MDQNWLKFANWLRKTIPELWVMPVSGVNSLHVGFVDTSAVSLDVLLVCFKYSHKVNRSPAVLYINIMKAMLLNKTVVAWSYIMLIDKKFNMFIK